MAKKQIIKTGTKGGYSQFLKHVNLYGLGMDAVKAELNREAYVAAHTDAPVGPIRIIRSNFQLTEYAREHFDVQAKFVLRVIAKDRLIGSFDRASDAPSESELEASSEDLLRIEASFTAHFHCSKGSHGKSSAERFAKSEARLIFWPYFRQAVSDITARMSIRPITVPIVLKP